MPTRIHMDAHWPPGFRPGSRTHFQPSPRTNLGARAAAADARGVEGDAVARRPRGLISSMRSRFHCGQLGLKPAILHQWCLGRSRRHCCQSHGPAGSPRGCADLAQQRNVLCAAIAPSCSRSLVGRQRCDDPHYAGVRAAAPVHPAIALEHGHCRGGQVGDLAPGQVPAARSPRAVMPHLDGVAGRGQGRARRAWLRRSTAGQVHMQATRPVQAHVTWVTHRRGSHSRSPALPAHLDLSEAPAVGCAFNLKHVQLALQRSSTGSSAGGHCQGAAAALWCAAPAAAPHAAIHTSPAPAPGAPAGSAPPRCCSAGTALHAESGRPLPGSERHRTGQATRGADRRQREQHQDASPDIRELHPAPWPPCPQHPPMAPASPMTVRKTEPAVPALRTSDVCTSTRYVQAVPPCRGCRGVRRALSRMAPQPAVQQCPRPVHPAGCNHARRLARNKSPPSAPAPPHLRLRPRDLSVQLQVEWVGAAQPLAAVEGGHLAGGHVGEGDAPHQQRAVLACRAMGDRGGFGMRSEGPGGFGVEQPDNLTCQRGSQEEQCSRCGSGSPGKAGLHASTHPWPSLPCRAGASPMRSRSSWPTFSASNQATSGWSGTAPEASTCCTELSPRVPYSVRRKPSGGGGDPSLPCTSASSRYLTGRLEGSVV